jgi:hypothetical protein
LYLILNHNVSHTCQGLLLLLLQQSNINVLYLDNKKTIQSPYYNWKKITKSFHANFKIIKENNQIYLRKGNNLIHLEGSKLEKQFIHEEAKMDTKIFTYDETNFMYNYINVWSQFSKKYWTKMNLYLTMLEYFIHLKGEHHLPPLISKAIVQKLFIVAWTFQHCYDFLQHWRLQFLTYEHTMEYETNKHR